LAFNASVLLGGTAPPASISRSACHVHGASNPKFYRPGSPTRPGNFITTGALFNGRANNRHDILSPPLMITRGEIDRIAGATGRSP